MNKIDNMNLSNGNFLNKSYDEKREISSMVIGVLKYNNKIRENLLKRNIGKYKLINLPDGIGYIPDIYASEFRKPLSLGEEGLLSYTHISDSNFKSYIKNQYDIDDNFSYYQFNPLRNNYKKWGGKYKNYIDYVNSVLSYPLNTQAVIDNFLAYKDIHKYVKNSRISILPKPYHSLSGEIVTNPSYLGGGIDTKIGVISNFNYARLLNDTSIINSIRKTKYITPSAYEKIGLKTNTINDLNSSFIIDEETGRLAYDFYNRSVLSINYGELPYNFNENGDKIYILGEKTNKILNNFLNTKDINGNIYHLNDKNKKYFTPINQYNFNDLITGTTLDKDYIDTEDVYDENSLLGKFQTYKNKTQTILSSYYDNSIKTKTLTQTAVNSEYGISHGRNLTIKDSKGKANPYCRVWKKHDQYNSVDKLISSTTLEKRKNLLQSLETRIRPKGSGDRLINNSVITNEGFVKISPTYINGSVEPIKNCMFSIENLAWKGYTDKLSQEQIGPNKGRVMWFPPYGITFNEVISTNWSHNEFIGRGEKIYTYANTERGGTLSFMLLIDYPSILDISKRNKTTNDDEEDVLRFFAGCDLLPLELETNLDKTSVFDNKNDSNFRIKNDFNEKEYVYLYFPNLYSGKDDNVYDVKHYLLTVYDEKTTDTPLGDYSKFCYRVDKKYENSKIDEENYKEKNPLKLNTTVDNELDKSFSEFIEKDLLLSDIKKIIIKGFSSSHGEGMATVNNIELAQNRAETTKKIIESVNPYIEVQIDSVDNNNVIKVDNEDLNNISGVSAKKARCVRIEIIRNSEPIIPSWNQFSNKNEMTQQKEVLITESNSQNNIKKIGEYEYFDKLKDSDNFTYKRIIDKIKYFTPAFHSITPEGFNERLSFLHQCTRQGPTCAVSDGNIKGRAGNLAFGRPPICVLRLGDFYNTKIIIESVTINYENNLWDMNHSGIGMQPMFANISLNFKFLGGSDLNAPVARLQNAVSFNYYANQSIYDSRAYVPPVQEK